MKRRKKMVFCMLLGAYDGRGSRTASYDWVAYDSI